MIKDTDEKRGGFLKNHILKTYGSIMDNIAEGFEREVNKEFIHFLSISKGSVGKLRSQLYRALDHDMIGQGDFNSLDFMLIERSQQLCNFIKYHKSSPYKGNKFSESRAEYSKNDNIDGFIVVLSEH
ncbi:MAG: four helix bundle protein [Flavobacteriia bacterium]